MVARIRIREGCHAHWGLICNCRGVLAEQRRASSVPAGTSLGLPELSLGVLPGFGGTQRLPRLVGLQQAVQMMLTSQPIKEKAALKAGLLDGVTPADQLLSAAKALALEIAAGLKPRNYSLFRYSQNDKQSLQSCLMHGKIRNRSHLHWRDVRSAALPSRDGS